MKDTCKKKWNRDAIKKRNEIVQNTCCVPTFYMNKANHNSSKTKGQKDKIFKHRQL